MLLKAFSQIPPSQNFYGEFTAVFYNRKQCVNVKFDGKIFSRVKQFEYFLLTNISTFRVVIEFLYIQVTRIDVVKLVGLLIPCQSI